MNISKINLNLGQKIAPKADETKNFSTNPFGVSFKGNVIQADVFEGATPNIAKKISNKGKLFASAIVGGINNFNNAFQSRMNAIVSFGKKIKTNVFSTFDKIVNTEISVDFNAFKTTLKNRIFPDSQFKVKNLVKRPVEELGTMLKAELA
ncbi:MAG: hypothetical protein PHV37_08055 [Candidatus Gastranaerophilales bacterium]|nr:hypothetical protein [Candidatus Gastranaerophilales bacterium]